MSARVVAVAYSGGRDSTALLHATATVAASLDLRVVALHVHHGLSAHADDWQRHGEETCLRWSRRDLPVQFFAERLTRRPAHGHSVEAWARQERYRALRAMALAQGAGLVLLAHHRRDQAETFLLQALRGGGVAAQSAMPRVVEREGVTWARPWLERSRDDIDAYVRLHRLRYIEDDSNDDTRFARNRLRADVWPALQKAFPDVETALASSARWAQQAAAALDEWVAIDLPAISAAGALDVAAWRTLSLPRQSAALRSWLRERFGRAAPASLVSRLIAELDVRSSSHWPTPHGQLRSHRGLLRHEQVLHERAPVASMVVDLSRAGDHKIAAWHGTFVVERVASQGIAIALVRRLELRERRAGDRFQAGVDRPPRSLKLQFQAAGVPAWQRTGPILCHEERMVFVAGLGQDARVMAVEGQPQVRLDWRAD